VAVVYSSENNGEQLLSTTGVPDVKFNPACWPKYQLLNSPWAKINEGKKKQKMEKFILQNKIKIFRFIFPS